MPTNHLLLGASFLDAQAGWLSGGGLTVLKTSDGGATWRAGTVFLPAGGAAAQRPNESVRGRDGAVGAGDAARSAGGGSTPSGSPTHERGWAVGGEGVIIATTDGGRTWRPQGSGVGDDLYDVKFFDEAEGWAVGRGGALLHTTDGGRTWADTKRVNTHALERLFTVGRRAWAVGFGGTIVALKG